MRGFISWTYVVLWFFWRLTIETPVLVIFWIAAMALIFGLGYWTGSH